MSENFDEIRLLLQKKAEYQAHLNLMPYDGTFCAFSINYNRLLSLSKQKM